VARAINAAGIAPPEGRAWYKTTVEAYLRQEGDERLRMLGQLAAFTLRNLANKLKPNRSLGHRATNRRKEQDSASKRGSP